VGSGATPTPSASPSASIGPSSSPSGSPRPSGQPWTQAELEVELIATFGQLWYCDPDYYPVAHEDEQRLAIERFEEVRADGDAFAGIVGHLGLGDGPYTDDEKLQIYRLWKQLNAISLEPADEDRLAFDLLFLESAGSESGFRVVGTIDRQGEIQVERRQPASAPNCPICLTRGTLIDTPDGRRRVEELRVGDPIWTVDATGRRIHGTIALSGSAPTPVGHRVVRVLLADGRVLTASPGHPLADGRWIGGLTLGDGVGGSRVAGLRWIPYAGSRTYDVLASGPTGRYWAGGMLLDSTLSR
jgi:hypothetical protein